MECFTAYRHGLAIRGMAHYPCQSTPAPCLFFCHGFTASRIEPHFMYVKIARVLAEMGIACIRFDFTGSGESDGRFQDMTIMTEVADLEAVIAWASTQERIDASRKNLLGFSKGSAVSILAAARHPREYSNLLLISPAANILDIYTREISGDKVQEYLEKGLVDVAGNLLSKQAIDVMTNINIYTEAMKVTAQALLVHGTMDNVVPPFTSIKLAEIWAGHSELALISGSDHWYSSADLESKLINALTDYARRNLL